MLPELSEDASYRNMFLDEARVAARINSPFVVSTFDLDVAADGSLYIVMDLVIGCSLAKILGAAVAARAPLPISFVATVGEQAAHGLHDAHEACTSLGEPLKIVHRDVSPQNILVGIDAAARITDFGVAYAAERLKPEDEPSPSTSVHPTRMGGDIAAAARTPPPASGGGGEAGVENQPARFASPSPSVASNGDSPCAGARRIERGTTTRGQTTRPNRYQNGCSGQTRGQEQVYRIELVAGEQVNVSVQGTWPFIVYFRGSCSGDLDAQMNACDDVIHFTPFHRGTYFLVVDSMYGPGGPFTLTID